MKKFGIIGTGKVGITLIEYLNSKDILEWVLARSEKSFNIVKTIDKNIRIFRNISDIDCFPDYTILAVNDRSIRELSSGISHNNNDLSGKVFSHCSGTLPKEELISLCENNAIIGAAHPYQTFYEPEKSVLSGVPWGIDTDPQNENIFKEMIKVLSGKPVILNDKAKKLKELYHISAVAASNYMNTIISMSDDILKEINLNPEEILRPIIETTLKNNFKMLRGETSQPPLTGPIIRGDVEIISKHIKALENYPELLIQYKLIGLATLESAYNKQLIGSKPYLKMKEVLS